MTSIQQWAHGLSNSDLITEFIRYYQLVEILSCYNSKDYACLVAVENELTQRGAAPSIQFATGGTNAEEELSKEERVTKETS